MIATILFGSATAWLLITCLFNFRKGRIHSNRHDDDALPTVSLLIPARNETHAIANTLHHALSLDYPKLEIIVLDDESGDATSEKIRSFAHDGIRFVQGSPMPEGWVGKNWACSQLAEAASGEYLIFCDTDVLLNSRGLHEIIAAMERSSLKAVSVLPRLLFMKPWQAWAYPLLHWTLLLIRQGRNKSYPAYGGLMAFEAAAYHRHGGWRHYHDRVLPELKIAQDFARYGQYGFFHNYDFGFLLLKKTNSLIEARTRYLRTLYRHFPGLGLLHAILALLPLVLLLWQLWWLYLVLAAAFVLMNWRQVNHSLIAGVLLPLISVTEIYLLLWSYLQHSRRSIAWKQRRI